MLDIFMESASKLLIRIFSSLLPPSHSFLLQHARGECDDALIKVTQDNGLFKDLARYLVERQDLELWTRVLKPEVGRCLSH